MAHFGYSESMNTFKKCAIVMSAVIALLLGGSFLAFSDEEATEIDLAANGGSGITATLYVSGREVEGVARGMDPEKRYISLYYGDQSTSTTGRFFTCADVRTAALTGAWGIRGEWNVSEDGTGTLSGTAPRELEDGVYTASIREVSPLALGDAYLGFNPVTYPVVACGEVPEDIQDAQTEPLQPVTETSGDLVEDVAPLPVKPNQLVTGLTGLK